MKVFLIGYMGVGKTSIGKALAKRLSLSYIDLDKAIELEAKKSVSEIFSEQGEAHFREMESSILESLAHNPASSVISTGGGTPCFGKNLELMKDNGVVVWLEMDIHPMLGRLHKAKASRPLISHLEPEELEVFVKKSYKERKSVYHKAHLRFNCNVMDKENYELLERIVLDYSK